MNILFYLQQLAASAILDNYRRKVLLYLLQVQVFTFYLYFNTFFQEVLLFLLVILFLELLLLDHTINVLVTAKYQQNTCSSVICRNACPNGRKIDKNGCVSCLCKGKSKYILFCIVVIVLSVIVIVILLRYYFYY